MNKLNVPVLATLAALSLAAVTVSAQDNSGPGMRHEKGMERHHREGPGMHAPEEMLSRMTEMLDLDENQSQSIRNIVDAAKPQFDSLRERSRANRDALRDLDINDPDYNAKLQNLSAESGQLASEMTLLHGQVRADIGAVLTAEQRQELSEHMDRMGDRPWRGPRPQPND